MSFEIKYDSKTDLLTSRFNNPNPVIRQQEIAPGVIVGFDANGIVVAVNVLNPGKNITPIMGIYRQLFVNERMYNFNQILYMLGLHGIGGLNFENEKFSGEEHFLQKVVSVFTDPVVLDIGANVGDYSSMLKRISPNAHIYAFEPHPVSFQSLSQCAETFGFTAINAGCGKDEGFFELFDYADNQGSQHASLFQNVIEDLHGKQSRSVQVRVTTIDAFAGEKQLDRIHLLKVDTEGNEMNVLFGASRMLAKKKIDLIHFEFNEMNVISRCFMKDFRDFLSDYRLFRLLPDGMVEVPKATLWSEIFVYQNIVAINPEVIHLFQ